MPLTSLMLKEGLICLLVVFALLAIMFVSDIIHTLDTTGNSVNVGKAAFSWYMALLSVAGSRLILSMRKVAVKHCRAHINDEDDACNIEESTPLTSFRE
ncbi:hypothetical protein CPB84DRAFT_1852274 [Gymnopilus junonius]|uniref:Uncharacterized protein n=1 Tax=Gymnopilus junonius TaxID=109634 RepID=A0A9P5TI23_GYMJU|nr:hypothetical protein CPB84DRAFT_1852274 [Gymnopilus junonius]